MQKLILTALAAMTVASPALADPIVTLSAGSSSLVTPAAVETFEGHSVGQQNFTDTISGVKFSYTGVYVNNDGYGQGNGDPYGAAYNGAGPAVNGTSYALTIDKTDANYFGLWIGSADPTNELQFFNGDQSVGSFLVGDRMVSQSGAFVNFNFGDQTFNKVVFTAGSGTGFESDNHTVATVAAVPEASTWAIMVMGLGGAGGALRLKRRNRLTQAAMA